MYLNSSRIGKAFQELAKPSVDLLYELIKITSISENEDVVNRLFHYISKPELFTNIFLNSINLHFIDGYEIYVFMINSGQSGSIIIFTNRPGKEHYEYSGLMEILESFKGYPICPWPF